MFLIIVKRQHVKVSTRHWAVINESDDKQTKSISNGPNPFSDNKGWILTDRQLKYSPIIDKEESTVI